MKKAFVDTSFWIALYDKRDKYHLRAKNLTKTIKKEKIFLITTDYIFCETLNFVLYHNGAELAKIIGEKILASEIIELEDLSKEDKQISWEIFQRHCYLNLSFTDCTSFAFMRNKNINLAFSFDSHFKKMGFEIYK